MWVGTATCWQNPAISRELLKALVLLAQTLKSPTIKVSLLGSIRFCNRSAALEKFVSRPVDIDHVQLIKRGPGQRYVSLGKVVMALNLETHLDINC